MVGNLSKSLYRAELLFLKVIPMLMAFVCLLNTVLSYYDIDWPFLSYLGSVSIFTLAFLYLSGVKGDIGDYNFYDFEVALNMIKSDYCPLLKRWFPDEDKDSHLKRLVSLTVNWLNDTDNPYGSEKVWGYFNK